jgi:hypothetical protein
VLERYAGALGHYRDPASASYEDSVDARELPGFTVEMVGQLPGDVQLMLGGMIRDSLGLTSADPARLVALWRLRSGRPPIVLRGSVSVGVDALFPGRLG